MNPKQQHEVDGDDALLGEDELLQASRFRVVRVQEACRDGSLRSRELIEHPGSVAIVPMLDDHTVCLIKVFRRAVGRTLVEIPAGTLDRVESLEAAAARELTEETGYRAKSLEAGGSLWMSPGILRERMHLFVARGLTPGAQALEPGEQIETFVVNWDEAVAMCVDGRIEDAKSVAAILLTDQRRKMR
jgi:ADP-ribose pyrophosphatase